MYIYLFQKEHLWRKRYGLIHVKNPSSRTLITMVVCACAELILNNDRLIHLVHLTLGAFGFFNK
jgi:hypothetical protein